MIVFLIIYTFQAFVGFIYVSRTFGTHGVSWHLDNTKRLREYTRTNRRDHNLTLSNLKLKQLGQSRWHSMINSSLTFSRRYLGIRYVGVKLIPKLQNVCEFLTLESSLIKTYPLNIDYYLISIVETVEPITVSFKHKNMKTTLYLYYN